MNSAERSVIGSLLIDPQTAAVIDEAGLAPEDMADTRCALALRAYAALRDDGCQVDAVTVASKMVELSPGEYDDWLAETMLGTPTAANIRAYCDIVLKQSQRRKAWQIMEEMSSDMLLGRGDSVGEAIGKLQELQETDRGIITDSGALAKSFARYYARTKADPETAYVKTGFQALDRQLGGGLMKSDIYIIGARPGMGKTTVAVNIAQNVVRAGKRVLFVSLEMSEYQIQAKRISVERNIGYTELLTGRLDSADEAKMAAELEAEKGQPFFLTTRSGLRASDIALEARRIPGLDLIIIDYLQLVACSEDSVKKPRYEQITEVSADLKRIAKRFAVPVIALCQLNRETAGRSDKRPQMSDLRDSGAIEQDAGAVILLHRPEYYADRESDDYEELPSETIELNVSKNRHAAPGVVKMEWWCSSGKIRDIGQKKKENSDGQHELPF